MDLFGNVQQIKVAFDVSSTSRNLCCYFPLKQIVPRQKIFILSEFVRPCFICTERNEGQENKSKEIFKCMFSLTFKPR